MNTKEEILKAKIADFKDPVELPYTFEEDSHGGSAKFINESVVLAAMEEYRVPGMQSRWVKASERFPDDPNEKVFRRKKLGSYEYLQTEDFFPEHLEFNGEGIPYKNLEWLDEEIKAGEGNLSAMHSKEFEEMDKVIKCLALELPAPVWEDVRNRWGAAKAALSAPEGDVKCLFDKLFEEIKHGDQEHQDWLRNKINGFVNTLK